MRCFVLISQTALASGAFSLEDLPASSGRLDLLLRALRAALLVSHGLRRSVLVYLVLRGGAGGSRVLRVDGRSAKFLRPDERSLAILVQKTLQSGTVLSKDFQEVRPGLALCEGDLEEVLAELAGLPCYLLDEHGSDVRAEALAVEDAVFFIGDQLGFEEATRARLLALGCRTISVGPLSLHSEDVVTLLNNELDRRFGPEACPAASPPPGP